MVPEYHSQSPHVITSKVDIWGLGSIACDLVTGQIWVKWTQLMQRQPAVVQRKKGKGERLPPKPIQKSVLDVFQSPIKPDSKLKGKDINAAVVCRETIIRPCLSINPDQRPVNIQTVAGLVDKVIAQSE